MIRTIKLTDDELVKLYKALDYAIDENSCHWDDTFEEGYRNLLEKMKKSLNQKSLSELILSNVSNEWGYLLDLFPSLEWLPICAWGRYYKYELSGELFSQRKALTPIEICDKYQLVCTDEQREVFQEVHNHLKETNELENIKESIYDALTLNRAFGEAEYPGCLALRRKSNGGLVSNDHFELVIEECDSPE